MLCTGCGNEIDDGVECPMCADKLARRESREQEREQEVEVEPQELTTSFCQKCGNSVYGDGPCEICSAAYVQDANDASAGLCPGCGNEVEDIHDCPICQTGHGRRRAPRSACNRILCINCTLPMDDQDWDGVPVRICDSCQAALFPPKALEQILDKLRETTEKLDYADVVKDLQAARDARGTVKDVRYRNCPDCNKPMSRVNYDKTSGIMLEHCGHHGTWVEQRAFTELSDWITRGGDQLAERARQRQGYNAPRFGR